MLKRCCDRCGKIIDVEEGFHLATSKNGTGLCKEHMSVDLCEECYESLMEWYKEPTTVGQER